MRFLAWLGALLALPVLAQPQTLPDLGGTSDGGLTPALERRIGESIIRDIRRDPAYLDEPEIADYLSRMGSRLAQFSPGTRYDFEFFVIKDPSINAFALPGGFIGVHTGLILNAETESEIAGVMGHEIAHVTQRHIARGLAASQDMQKPMLAALALAIALARSRPDLATGAMIGSQAAAVQAQLGYSRDFEREADRMGMQALEGAGYDTRAMAAFFEKLQRNNRLGDDGSVPGYLRTHPLTTDRIADMQNKASSLPYRQQLDSLDFHLVRAKLRAEMGEPRAAIAHFDASVKEGRYANEIAARYGLASALLRERRGKEAEAEVARIRTAGGQDVMIDTLAARAKIAAGDSAGALSLLAAARAKEPHSRPLLYAQLEALDGAGRHQDVLKLIVEPLRQYPREVRLHQMQAKTYAALGRRASQHQAQAEVYVLNGSLPAAIEQLQLARGAGDGDFYQMSVIDSRLRELRAQHAQELKDAKK